jgi:hypothetical protein
VLGAERTPDLLDLLVGLEPVMLVACHAARIVVDHHAERSELGAQPQDLVHLLLILGHDHAHLGVVPDECELLGDGILVHGHRHATQALHGELSGVQTRPVVPDDRQAVAPPEPEGGQPQREVSHLAVILPPRPRLPDPPVLLADGRTLSQLAGIAQEQMGKGSEIRHVGLHWWRPWGRPDRP